jgi:hypothetical protein
MDYGPAALSFLNKVCNSNSSKKCKTMDKFYFRNANALLRDRIEDAIHDIT